MDYHSLTTDCPNTFYYVELTTNSTLVIMPIKEVVTMADTFGQYLREQRRKAKISQRELARQVSVDFSYISKLENDRLPPPSARTVIAIADVLGTPRDEILARVGKIPDDVEEAIGTSPGAQSFLQEAQLLKPSDHEWEEMRATLVRLRESDA